MDCGALGKVGNVGKGVAMIRLVPGEIRLKTNSECERKPGLDLEFILEKEMMLPDSRGAAGLPEQKIECVEASDQKIRQGIACVQSSEADTAALGKFRIQLPVDL